MFVKSVSPNQCPALIREAGLFLIKLQISVFDFFYIFFDFSKNEFLSLVGLKVHFFLNFLKKIFWFFWLLIIFRGFCIL